MILYKKSDIVYGLALILLVAAFVFFVTGCSSAEITDMDLPENRSQEELISQIESWDANTSVIGSITHGVRRDEMDGTSLIYTGGELQIPYTVTAAGSAVNVGFLIFLDGKPQKYHYDENGNEYYCHMLKLESGVEKEFTLSFTPTCGEAGEKLQVTILSVYNPNFRPDMRQTSGYGMYHNTLMAAVEVEMKSASSGGQKGISAAMVMDIAQGKEEITREFLEGPISNFYGMQQMSQENLDQNIFDGVCYNGEYLQNNVGLSEEPLQITYRIFGRDGSRYKVTPFIDHVPVADAQDILVSKGEISTITLSIDPEKLEDFSTFYFIAIPESTENELAQRKTDSILLYKAEALSDSEVENQADANGEWFNSWEFDGGVRQILYAGEGKILIQADSFWLYDMEDKRMAGQYTVEEEGTVWGLKVVAVPDGYLLIGTIVDSFEDMESAEISMIPGIDHVNRVRCWCFDQNFEWQKTLALDEMLAGEEKSFHIDADASPDGNQIILTVMNDTLYLYHMDTEQLDRMEEIPGRSGEMARINEAGFDYEGNYLILSITKAGDYVLACWKVDPKGEDILCNTMPDGAEQLSDMIICQDEIIYCYAEGKLFIVDETDFSDSIFALDTDDPAKYVSVSDHGRYIATASYQENKMGWRIRIYERASGEKIFDQNVGTDDEKYFYRAPAVCIFDERNQCIVLNGSEENSLIYSFSFHK